ncbi:MAG: sensor domain-containing diguanylate cyclase [Rhodospirillales bacterium]|nr:sensor domain-containing diguanylate cyclase [Rhodospirillales bacterium]
MNLGSPIYDRIRSHGPTRVALEVVAFCLISAVVLCYGILYAFDRPFSLFSILLPILVPIAVAAPLAYVAARMVADLDSTIRRAARSERTLRGIMDNMSDVFYRTDLDGKIVMVSRSLTAAAGWDVKEVIGTPLSNYYDDPDSGVQVLEELRKSGGRANAILVPMICKDGSIAWTSVNARFYEDEDGNVAGVEGMVRVVTEQISGRKKLGRMANHDQLTGLASRTLLLEQVRGAIREEGECSALVRFDIDGFNPLNEKYGANFCDGLVIEIASRVRRAVRTDDLVARSGGDEFAIFMNHLPGVEALTTILDKLREEIELPFNRDGEEISLTVSLGAVILRDETTPPESAFEKAGKALAAATAAGGGRFIIHEQAPEYEAV